MVRLFIAVDFPEHVNHELRRAQEEITEAVIKPAKEFHLTLKFLGDRALEKIAESLEKVKFESFKAELTSLGVFPDYNYVRVVWVGVTQEQFIKLHQEIEENLSFKPDKNYHPHVTLARVKRPKNKEKFIQSLEKISVKPEEFEVSEFHLVKSTLTRQGPMYEILRTYKLK